MEGRDKKASPEENIQTDLLKSFYDQFASNQNHHQTLFIQFISAVLVVIIGYAIIFSNTNSDAGLHDVTRDKDNNIVSYSIIQLAGAYLVTEFVLVLLASLILNIGYSFRRDQKIIYNIRQTYLGPDLYNKIFEGKSFNPAGKKLIKDSFLPGFNLIFVCFIYFLQVLLVVSMFITIPHLKNFPASIWNYLIIAIIILSPLGFSASYLDHFYCKYKKVVNE